MNPFEGNRAPGGIAEGSLAHYAEPAYYTKCYASRRHDVLFYVELAQQRKPGSMLEYGCGNGRITLPVAASGTPVVGVDASPAMIDDLQARLGAMDTTLRERIRLVRGDMRTVRLREKFDLIVCTFNTFLHLYERQDVENFLARVKQHLAPQGSFVFDVSVPLCEELGRDPNKPYRIPRMRYPATGDLVRYAEYFDYNPVSQILNVAMRFEPIDAPERGWTTPLTHRQFHPREIEALLHYNGFVVDEVRADFEERPLHSGADSGVWFTRVAPPRKRP